MKVDIDRENNIVTVWKEGKYKHIGVSEQLDLIGAEIVIDRDKKGRVQALEIMLYDD